MIYLAPPDHDLSGHGHKPRAENVGKRDRARAQGVDCTFSRRLWSFGRFEAPLVFHPNRSVWVCGCGWGGAGKGKVTLHRTADTRRARRIRPRWALQKVAAKLVQSPKRRGARADTCRVDREGESTHTHTHTHTQAQNELVEARPGETALPAGQARVFLLDAWHIDWDRKVDGRRFVAIAT